MPKFRGCAWPRNPNIWVVVRLPAFKQGYKIILFVKTEIPRLRMAPKSKYLGFSNISDFWKRLKMNSFRKNRFWGYFCSPLGPHGFPVFFLGFYSFFPNFYMFFPNFLYVFPEFWHGSNDPGMAHIFFLLSQKSKVAHGPEIQIFGF